jgi:hypothetical protein
MYERSVKKMDHADSKLGISAPRGGASPARCGCLPCDWWATPHEVARWVGPDSLFAVIRRHSEDV